MKRMNLGVSLGVIATLSVIFSGCGMGFGDLAADEPTGLAAQVAGKALTIGEQIGGENGFGGTVVDGYFSHMDDHMGFHGASDLADAEGYMTVVLRNESTSDSTFDVVYVASHMGIDEQWMEVGVPMGGEVSVELPCSEIVGLGSLTVVGDVAVQLADGDAFDNTMCVPAFLGSDYFCGSTYHALLSPDIDDLDEDGDTEELIVTTEALESHTGPGGMGRHGPTMMGWR